MVGGPDVATKYRLTLRGTLAHAPVGAGALGRGQLGVLRRHLRGPAGDRGRRRAGLQSLRGVLRHQGPAAVPLRDHLGRGHQAPLPGAGPEPVGQPQSQGVRRASATGPVCLKVFVSHPNLTRGRHYRFRVCADVFWKDSFTIIHGSHQFFKNPNKEQPFRLIDSVIRGGHVVMTVPNYDLDMGSDDTIVDRQPALGKKEQKRSRTRPVEEVHFERRDTPSNSARLFRRVLQGLRHLVLVRAGGRLLQQARQAGQHLRQPSRARSASTTARTRRSGRTSCDVVEQAVAAGFMIHPSFIPVMHGRSKLGFGFNYDASNPPFEHYWLRFYAADGAFLGEMRWRKDFIGPAFIEDVLNVWGSPERYRVAGALICARSSEDRHRAAAFRDHRGPGGAPPRDRRPGRDRVPAELAQPRRRGADAAALAASLDRRDGPHQRDRPRALPRRLSHRRVRRQCQRQSEIRHDGRGRDRGDQPRRPAAQPLSARCRHSAARSSGSTT